MNHREAKYGQENQKKKELIKQGKLEKERKKAGGQHARRKTGTDLESYLNARTVTNSNTRVTFNYAKSL